jgi:hypothetical protein
MHFRTGARPELPKRLADPGLNVKRLDELDLVARNRPCRLTAQSSGGKLRQ